MITIDCMSCGLELYSAGPEIPYVIDTSAALIVTTYGNGKLLHIFREVSR